MQRGEGKEMRKVPDSATWLPLLLILCWVFWPTGEASGGAIATYNVASHTDTTGSTSMPVTSYTSGLSPSAITFGNGNLSVGGDWYDGGSFCALDWSSSSTPVANEYFELSIAPQSGNTITFSDVQFALARDNYSGGSGPANVLVSYSTDGSSFNPLITLTMPAEDLMQYPVTLDLSSIPTITSTIWFRWQGYNSPNANLALCFANAPESSTYFQGTGRNLVFNGTVGAPNEYPTATDLSISGDPTVGQTLTAVYTYQDTEGDPESGTTFQWYRADDAAGTNKTAISGAVGQTYVLTSDDGHKYLNFTVTPGASSGSTPGSTYESDVSSQINILPPYATNVFISGSAMVGKTMTGNYTFNDDQGHSEAAGTYQWYRADDMSGTNRTAVSDATTTSYTVQPTDEGKNFSFEVTVVADTAPTTGDPVETGFTPAVVQPAIAHYSVGEHLVTQGKNEFAVEYVIPGSGVSASVITLGPGINGVPAGNNFTDGGSFCASGFTTASSPDPNDYFQLVLTPEAGNQITYQNVQFGLAREYLPTDYIGPPSVQVRYSTDGTNFSTLQTLALSAVDFGQIQFQIDLSFLGTVTGPIWFRWYGYATSGVNSQFADLCFANADAGTTNFNGTGGDLRFNGTSGPTAVCGDGNIDPGEVCDDNNTTSGDGCSADCLSDETCGNSYIDTATGETCDDGNNAPGDGCGPTCLTEICGNGYLDPGEVCDDNNTTSGDGCSADCLSDETCGNSYIDTATGETCDDGNNAPGDGCGPTCLTEVCGNGYLDPGEVCDDNNTTSGDGCSADCLSNETCGNGYIDTAVGEVCDDNNTSPGDGCSADCLSNEPNSPVITPSQVFSVDENAPDTTWVGTVSATDADAGTTFGNWTIGTGNSDAIFAIDPDTGEITVADNTNLDFETTNSYTLGITVSDGIHTSTAEDVTISINDMNDPPFFTDDPSIHGVSKVGNTISLINTGTDDPDGDTVTLGYQWATNGANIPGAISDSYLLTKDEISKKVKCTISADDGNGGLSTYITAEVTVMNNFPWWVLLPGLTSPNKVSVGGR